MSGAPVPWFTVAEHVGNDTMEISLTRLGGQSASLSRRFGALVVDWILCVFASRLIADPRVVAWLPSLVLIVVYGFFLGFFGQTIGMRMTRIRCVATADGGPIGPVRALLRGVLLVLVVPALIMDGQRRGLHDRAAGSIMVDARGAADPS